MKHVAQTRGSRCCGQACIAMVLGKTLTRVCAVIGVKGTHYVTLRHAAGFFGKELGPIVQARNASVPTTGVHIARILFSRKPHISHFVVLKGRSVFDPACDGPCLRTDWLQQQRRYWGIPELTFTSWVRAGRPATIYDCPVCGNGKLKREEYGWRCNGLADPDNNSLPLVACEYWVERLPKRSR